MAKLPQGWEYKDFNDSIKDITGGNIKIQKKDYLKTGNIPIIDQGAENIGGFTNDINCVVNSSLPLIIFGDHTRIFKYVDYDFAIGADGVKVLKPKNDINVKYLYYYLIKNQNKIPNTGYNRHFKYLKELKITYPPINEQKKIAAILDKADKIRQMRKKVITKLDELIQATFIDMFGDLINNQKNWEIVRFDSIFKTIRYGVSSPPKYSDFGIPFIRATNVKFGRVSKKGLVYISEEEAIKISKCKLKESDLIIVRSGANTGDCSRIPKEYEGSYGGFDMIIEIDEPYSTFYNFLLNSKSGKKVLDPLTRRAGQPHLNSKQISELNVILPPIQLQNQFAERVQTIEKLKEKAEKSLQKSEDLFNSLMQNAFKGNLEISDNILKEMELTTV